MDKLVKPTLEDWFEFWLQDLIDKGYILKVLRAKEAIPFVLFEGLYKVENTPYKLRNGVTGYKPGKITLLHPIEYTPDFIIIWADKAKGIFHTPFEECSRESNMILSFSHNKLNFSLIEIKAPPGYGGANSSDASFRVKQKWVWEKYALLVQKIYLYPIGSKGYNPKDYLWSNTFTPTRYLMTDGLTKARTINKWKVTTVDEFLDKKKLPTVK